MELYVGKGSSGKDDKWVTTHPSAKESKKIFKR
jgi:hypothetical protein